MTETYARTWDLDDIEIQRGGDGRTVTAYAAVFGQETEIRDQHGHYLERIDPRAFAKTLAETRPDRIGVLYNHGRDSSGKPNMVGSVPIGTPLEVRADGRGLLTVTRYNRSDLADAVLAAISDGQIRGQSFRGRIYKSTERPGGRLPTVTRTELGLSEYGPTPNPAYEDAAILAVRAAQDPSALLTLIRTMITEHGTGILQPPAISTPHPGEPDTREPGTAHSRRAHLTRNRLRALELGVFNAEAPDKR